MKLFIKILIPLMVLFLVIVGRAEKSNKGIKIGDVDTSEDTSIVIKKGPITESTCVSYEIVDSTEELEGEEKYDRGDALKSWKGACEEWKTNFRELNKQNSILSMSCGKSQLAHSDGYYRASSTAKYKIKVRMKEKAVPASQ